MQPDVKRLQFNEVSLDELAYVAAELVQAIGLTKVILLHGDMGAGKTTFVKFFCKALGVMDATASPTFSIVNEYKTKSGDTVYHFDFYRIKESEAYDIGVEEYFDSGSYCLVEWPEKIPSMLPLRYAEVFITPTDNTHRTIAFSIHD
jgi:tRNA threonylcarbamoyladenosine biosynthesis protein TsaE